MDTTVLGQDGPRITRLGLGCMNLSEGGPRDDDAARRLLLHARDRGITFFDTANRYGNGHNEELLAGTFGDDDGVVIATKVGFHGKAVDPRPVDARPETLRTACDESLARLGRDRLDLWYLHRVDPEVPVEESVGTMAELVAAGKVAQIGICEISPRTLRRAHAVHPVAAVQSEYSLWSRDVEAGTLPACQELGTTFVAYSPLGMGFLAGSIRTAGDTDDARLARSPRLSEENAPRNAALADRLVDIAGDVGCTAAQLSVAWLLHHDPPAVPIPGTTRITHLDDLVDAAEIALPDDVAAELDRVFAPGQVAGDRKHAPGMLLVEDPSES